MAVDSGAAILFGVLVIGYILIAPLVALIRSKRTREQQEIASKQVSKLTSRIYELEQRLAALEKPAGRPVIPPETIPQVEIPKWPAPISTVVKAPVPPLLPPESEVKTAGAESDEKKSIPPIFAASSGVPRAEEPSQKEKWTNLEEKLGANWLNKIGTAVFVIGVALFLSYSMRHLGPAGKIALGYTASAALLGFGLWGELHDRYRILSRAVLGGGWAIAYFTTYAMSNIRAVKLIDNASLGFLLLFVVAAAMVFHSLRYHSETTTGFAYLLAFASVAISRMSLGTLTASALLAASLAVVLWRRRWYNFEPLAIAATYGVHFLWLRQVFHALGGRKPFPEFGASAALLSVYWAVWMVSYFLREESDRRTTNLLTVSFLANATGYLLLLHYQSFHPEWRFWFLLVAGAVYTALAPLASRRARRRAFILTTTIGGAMIAAAFPYRYAGTPVEIVWLIEAETFLVTGWRLAERHLRNLGWLTAAALSIYVLFHDLSFRLVFWRPPNVQLGLTLVTLAAAFYLQAKLFRRWLGEAATPIDDDAARASIIVATFFVLAAAWVALPFLQVGVVWAGIAAILAEVGRRSRDADLQFSGHGAAVLAAVRLLSNDMPWAAVYHGLGWLTVGLAACMFYLASRRIVRPAVAAGASPENFGMSLLARCGGVPAAYTWAGTLLAALLIWRELSGGAVGLGWAMLGLLLLEAARTLRDKALANQALALFALSFARIFFADLNVETILGHFSSRLISVVALALIYYYAALSTPRGEFPNAFPASRRRDLYLWFGWGALVGLARFEFPAARVAVAWAVVTVVLFLIGRSAEVRTLRYQAYALTILLGVRCAFDNFYQTGPGLAGLNVRTVTVLAVSVLLYALLAFTIALKKRAPHARPETSPGPEIAEARHD
jgi:uncharacterized membrane protein